MKTLYCHQRLTLTKAIQILQENYNIELSYVLPNEAPSSFRCKTLPLTILRRKQWKVQLKKWGLGKNLTREALPHLLRHQRRAECDPERPKVLYREHPTNRAKLAAYLKRLKMSEEEVLAAADPDELTPEYVTLEYPLITPASTADLPPGALLDPSPSACSTLSDIITISDSVSTSFHETKFGSQRDESIINLPNESEHPSYAQLSLDSSEPAALPTLPQTSIVWPIEIDADPHIQATDLHQPAGIVTNLSTSGHLLFGSRPIADQNQSIRELTYHHAERSLPALILAEFFTGSTKLNNASSFFQFARAPLQAMITGRHPDCLTTLNVILSISEALGQSRLMGGFLASLSFHNHHHKDSNPIAASVDFMIAIATRKVKHSRIGLQEIEMTRKGLKDLFGPDSPSALIGIYHVAWLCTKAAEHRELALSLLGGLLPSATRVFGPSHLFTLACMATMARVLSYIRSGEGSLSLMQDVVQAIDWKSSHLSSYRLRMQYRQAHYLIIAGYLPEAVQILRVVYTGQVHLLGSSNVLTIRALKKLRSATQKSATALLSSTSRY
jgi:hypothetical protein